MNNAHFVSNLGATKCRPLWLLPYRWRRGVSLVNGVCGEDVGREYVKRHFPESSKQRMGHLVDNLIDAYRVSITNSDWLGEETKAKALEKLSKFTPMIGYTERWRDYTAFDVHADAGLVANMQAAALYEWGFQLSKAGKPGSRCAWGRQSPTQVFYVVQP